MLAERKKDLSHEHHRPYRQARRLPGLTKVAAKAIVDDVLKAITGSAVSGEEVNFPDFGKFEVKESPTRQGRNPSTGAAVQIAASKKLAFTPAKALKDKLNS